MLCTIFCLCLLVILKITIVREKFHFAHICPHFVLSLRCSFILSAFLSVFRCCSNVLNLCGKSRELIHIFIRTFLFQFVMDNYINFISSGFAHICTQFTLGFPNCALLHTLRFFSHFSFPDPGYIANVDGHHPLGGRLPPASTARYPPRSLHGHLYSNGGGNTASPYFGATTPSSLLPAGPSTVGVAR